MSWNLSKERPIYIQLVEQIKLQILSGHYRPGERFPSVRNLPRKRGKSKYDAESTRSS